jgi:8-oxo-dGTP diphosphatase
MITLLEKWPQAVVGLIWQGNNNDRLLLAISRKNNHKDTGLPGGKVEDGESLEEAMCRELKEEIGISVIGMERIFQYPCGIFQSHTFLIKDYEETPTSLEDGAIIKWVYPFEITRPECSFKEYNKALFEYLNIPINS